MSKRLILFLLLGLAMITLTSCKTVDCYQYVYTETYPLNYTMEIPAFHYHQYNEVTDSMYCVYVPPFRCEINDTLHIEMFELKKTSKRKCL